MRARCYVEICTVVVWVDISYDETGRPVAFGRITLYGEPIETGELCQMLSISRPTIEAVLLAHAKRHWKILKKS
jgi:hypothetical protein